MTTKPKITITPKEGNTIEKQWVVMTYKNQFFINFESIGEYDYEPLGSDNISEAKIFTDIGEAETIAITSGGKIKEVTE